MVKRMNSRARSITYALLSIAIIFIIMAQAGECFAASYIFASGRDGSAPAVMRQADGGAWEDVTPSDWTTGQAFDMVFDNSGNIFVAGRNISDTYGYIYISADKGSSWDMISPTGPDSWSQAWALSRSSDGRTYAGGLVGPYSDQLGAVGYYDGSWHDIDVPLDMEGVLSVAADPSSGIVYAGTTDGKVYVYTESTQEWDVLSSGDFALVQNLLVDKDGNLYAAGYDTALGPGLIEKYDGAGWTDITPDDAVTGFMAMDMSGGTLYAVGRDGANGAVFASRDGGITWEDISPAGMSLIDDIDVYRGIIYVGGNLSAGGGAVFQSADSGLNWTDISPMGMDEVDGGVGAHAPELPPGALQLLMTLLAGGLAWAKRRFK